MVEVKGVLQPCGRAARAELALADDEDAVVGDDGSVIGDPTEAALVVLAAKLGVDAEETRRAYPRLSALDRVRPPRSSQPR